MQKVQLNQVCGFEDVQGYYHICREGDICWIESINGKVISGAIDSDGYRRICLKMNSGKQKVYRQHRIFLVTFKPNPENKPQVNHLDSNRSNNLLSNLVWCDNSENQLHAYKDGYQKAKYGEQNGRAKLKDLEIPLIFDMRKAGNSLREIGKHFGISHVQISAIIHGQSRSQIKE